MKIVKGSNESLFFYEEISISILPFINETADGFNENKPRAQKAKLHEDFFGSEILPLSSLVWSDHYSHIDLVSISFSFLYRYDALPQSVLYLTTDHLTKSKEVNLNKNNIYHSRPPSAGVPGPSSRITKLSRHAALASSSKYGPKKPKKVNDLSTIEKPWKIRPNTKMITSTMIEQANISPVRTTQKGCAWNLPTQSQLMLLDDLVN